MNVRQDKSTIINNGSVTNEKSAVSYFAYDWLLFLMSKIIRR